MASPDRHPERYTIIIPALIVVFGVVGSIMTLVISEGESDLTACVLFLAAVVAGGIMAHLNTRMELREWKDEILDAIRQQRAANGDAGKKK